MYSGTGDDVQVKRTGAGNAEESMNMGNTSMAGLSDYSMGDIQRVGSDSMADYSMASLGDDQMVRVDGKAEQAQDDMKANLLDDLKQELGMVEISNPQNDNSFIK